MSSRVGRRISTPSGTTVSGVVGRLADRVDVLLPEAEPEPGVDEGGSLGGHERVVGGAALLDPAGRGERVEVADVLGLSTACPAASTQTFGPQVVSARGVPSR